MPSFHHTPNLVPSLPPPSKENSIWIEIRRAPPPWQPSSHLIHPHELPATFPSLLPLSSASSFVMAEPPKKLEGAAPILCHGRAAEGTKGAGAAIFISPSHDGLPRPTLARIEPWRPPRSAPAVTLPDHTVKPIFERTSESDVD